MRYARLVTLFVLLAGLTHAAWSQSALPPISATQYQQMTRPRLPNLPIPGGSVSMPMLKNGYPEAFVQFSRPKVTYGLAMELPKGYTYEEVVQRGFNGVQPGADSPEPALYFKTAEDEITAATGTFFVNVEYFDRGQGALEIEYLAQVGDSYQKRRDRVFLGDSGFWQEHVFTLSGASLEHKMESETDFRLLGPGVPLRRVGISRIPPPTSKPQGESVSGVFRQQPVSPPPGFFVGVNIDGVLNDAAWKDETRVEEKTQLYSSWGAQFIIETIHLGDRVGRDGRFDFSDYKQHAEALQSAKLDWTPRFKIGFVGDLPLAMTQSLQRAEGAETGAKGPMLSLWEPKLDDLYAAVFNQMSGALSSRYTRAVVLSFAGDWGPFLLSSESGGWSGRPDIWAGDPLARAEFSRAMQQRYGDLNAVGAAWGASYANWSQLGPTYNEDTPLIKNIDVVGWYRNAMIVAAERVIQRARAAFPGAQLILEIGDEFTYSASDARDFAALAARTGSSILYLTSEPVPTRSWHWLWLAESCRERKVAFGLRLRGGGEQGVLGGLYSLQSEGGAMLTVNEEVLAEENGWKRYAEAMGGWRGGRPDPRVAVVLPRLALMAEAPFEFERAVRSMRGDFAFDVVDEADLGMISPSDHPLIFVPWGEVWTSKGLQALENLARGGAALIVRADSPWRTINGDVSVNERIFAVKLEQQGGRWVFTPRGSHDDLAENKTVVAPDRTVVYLGSRGDSPFLGGQWGEEQGEEDARQLGLAQPSFRWFGERASVTAPIRRGRDYTLTIEGFMPRDQKNLRVFVDGNFVGEIVADGPFSWRKDLVGELRPRGRQTEIMLRGRPGLFPRRGEVIASRVSAAISRIGITPRGEPVDRPDDRNPDAPSSEFARESLRGSWMREVGQGYTVLAPTRFVNEWVYNSLLKAVVRDPSMLGPRFRFTLAAGGGNNGVFVSPQSGFTAYLNLNDAPVELRAADSRRRFTLQPNAISYGQ
ncbi:MAG: hypothetical protein GC154_05760 [bacterium]|nr:hypothetical protein [bacterium]